MIDDHTKALIDASLDGALSDSERNELDRRLKQSEQARAYQAEMARVDSILDRADEIPLPEGLHDQIMSRIELPTPAPRSRWFDFRFKQVPGFLRYGFAAAAGLIIAVAIYEIRPELADSQDYERMVGTMVPERNETAGVIDQISFDDQNLSSLVSLERRDGALVLDVKFDASQPVALNISISGSGFVFDALAQSESDIESFELADQLIRAKGSGKQEFTVLLARDDGLAHSRQADIRLEFSDRGVLIREGKLVPDW